MAGKVKMIDISDKLFHHKEIHPTTLEGWAERIDIDTLVAKVTNPANTNDHEWQIYGLVDPSFIAGLICVFRQSLNKDILSQTSLKVSDIVESHPTICGYGLNQLRESTVIDFIQKHGNGQSDMACFLGMLAIAALRGHPKPLKSERLCITVAGLVTAARVYRVPIKFD